MDIDPRMLQWAEQRLQEAQDIRDLANDFVKLREFEIARLRDKNPTREMIILFELDMDNIKRLNP